MRSAKDEGKESGIIADPKVTNAVNRPILTVLQER